MAKAGAMPAMHCLTVDRLLGVDLAADPSTVTPQRSPRAVNMLRSIPGSVEKRPGFRQTAAYPGAIHGCYELDGVQILHAGERLYVCGAGQNGTPLEGRVADTRSRGYCLDGRLYILDGSEFWQVYKSGDTFALRPVSEDAYLPHIAVSKNPDGSGGAELEAVNLLSDRWCESFYSSGEATEYQLEFEDLDETPVTAELVCAVENGGTVRRTLTENVDFRVDRTAGRVQFLEAPGRSPVEGEDNVFITASRDRSQLRRRITQADVCAVYGLPGEGMRLFVTGAPEWKNRDFWSAAGDPTYFSDLAYSVLGADDGRILGYSLLGDALAAHKSGENGAVWVRTADQENYTDAWGVRRQELVFRTGSVITGPGAVAKDSFAVLGDEPLFLTAQGVFALTASELTGVRYQQRRSWYIDPALCAEADLSAAQAIVWKDFYLLALNGRIYCLDGLQKSYTANAPKSSYQYECYLLEGIPVRTLWVRDGHLWFGTQDGRVCVFSDGTDAADYTDRLTGQAPAAVSASWETPDLTGDSFYREKNFRWLAVRVKPATATSVQMYADSGGIRRVLRQQPITARYLSFSCLTFSKTCFSCDTAGKTLGLRLHEYRRDKVRFRFENNETNEPFGLLGWAVEYTQGRRHRR